MNQRLHQKPKTVIGNWKSDLVTADGWKSLFNAEIKKTTLSARLYSTRFQPTPAAAAVDKKLKLNYKQKNLKQWKFRSWSAFCLLLCWSWSFDLNEWDKCKVAFVRLPKKIQSQNNKQPVMSMIVNKQESLKLHDKARRDSLSAPLTDNGSAFQNFAQVKQAAKMSKSNETTPIERVNHRWEDKNTKNQAKGNWSRDNNSGNSFQFRLHRGFHFSLIQSSRRC